MNIKKINVIAGSWVDSDFHAKIYPRLDQAGIPICRQNVLPLTRLFDDSYWQELKAAHRIDFAILDHLHWQQSDEIFDKYLERISSVRFPVICVAECPFGFERPLRIDPRDFAKKLFERTRNIFTEIKKKHPDTIVLSPGIGLIEEGMSRFYLDYFIHNKQFFDGYALHICNNMREHDMGQISSFLNQVLEVSPKKLWVTKWAIPSYDGKIINTQVIDSSGWEPFKFSEAVQRLERSFAFIETIAPVGSHWFYTGIGKDYYKPRRKPGSQEFWDAASSCVVPREYSHGWEYWHFLGLMDSDGKIKEPLLQSLSRLANQNE